MSDEWQIDSKSERGYLLRDDYGRAVADVFDPATAMGIVRAMNGFNTRATRAEDEAFALREALMSYRHVRTADDGFPCWCLTEHAHRKYGCDPRRPRSRRAGRPCARS